MSVAAHGFGNAVVYTTSTHIRTCETQFEFAYEFAEIILFIQQSEPEVGARVIKYADRFMSYINNLLFIRFCIALIYKRDYNSNFTCKYPTLSRAVDLHLSSGFRVQIHNGNIVCRGGNMNQFRINEFNFWTFMFIAPDYH